MNRFYGEYRHNLDSKGRLAIPADFRSSLGQNLHITIGIENNITIYTDEQWERLDNELSQMSDNRKDVRTYRRLLFGNARECEIDSQGRIMIPSNLIKYAQLVKECVIIGVGNNIEIWNSDNYDELTNNEIEKLSEIAEHLA